MLKTGTYWTEPDDQPGSDAIKLRPPRPFQPQVVVIKPSVIIIIIVILIIIIVLLILMIIIMISEVHIWTAQFASLSPKLTALL